MGIGKFFVLYNLFRSVPRSIASALSGIKGSGIQYFFRLQLLGSLDIGGESNGNR